ncbi:hypothetical protein [Pseudomarimonas arenosa]|uniref:Apea-like HEPN domain-containing protein n=1 Tax=Pseudomarimonas arenosa TaxID=2774145 RepID=A0AAW3ZGR8_9GAMM|nr:hypothetical protein [Pseudomarimonas arenosa]MBD8525315.1 hypothetical protein [Pseudomarimonas arenosa]
MKLRSVDRFRARTFGIEAALIGAKSTFAYEGRQVSVALPQLDQVGDRHDENAAAVCSARRGNSPLYYSIRFIEISIELNESLELPESIVEPAADPYSLLSIDQRKLLDEVGGKYAQLALGAFAHWIAVLRWVTGYHWICRDERIDTSTGWPTRLVDMQSGRDAWTFRQVINIRGYPPIRMSHWEKLAEVLKRGAVPPIYAVLYGDAMDHIANNEHRIAFVDLAVACEVFLRMSVLSSLPVSLSGAALAVIDNANINQYVTHLYPELLSASVRDMYKKDLKPELSSLFDKRNKVLHSAHFEVATPENCRRFAKLCGQLFQLDPDSGFNPRDETRQARPHELVFM